MNIHEYQAKQVLKGFGAPIANGVPITSLDQAESAISALPGPVWVVKSQIHAGGRGKGKFKELAEDAKEAMSNVKEMFGNTLVTKQTGPAGKQVNRLYIEDGADIERELYLSILVDRETGKTSFVASTEGGMDIEAVAEETPDKIHTIGITASQGVTEADADKIADAYELTGDTREQGKALFKALYEAFSSKDMSLLEINPLIVTKAGDIQVLDAKISFDGNALFRHPDIMELRDETEEDDKEIEASNPDLAYSLWMAKSAVWSTARALPWRRWTSSSSTALRLRTSLMLAAARPPKRLRQPSRSSPPTPTSKVSWSTSLVASCVAT
ncbi:UNVERIFIED_CONTAM: hypothetical protein GTU68_040026 [Idotea baltica]|nr:hypothetical protein [Idotea baltica]